MQWAPIGIGFSIFLAAGISHAFNLIDGLNGLSGFIAVGISLSLAAISHQMGLDEHRDVLFILSSAIAGFLVFNFPFGKIFLGDGGAYVIGHILVWMAISILCAAPKISPLAMLLIFFFPVADTLLAIMRRVYLGVPILYPDRLHFHQVVMRGIEMLVLGQKRRHIANPLAAAFILPFAFTPMVVGIFLVLDRGKAMIALLLFTALFLMTYKICMGLICRFRRYP
jgi:UDP-N-acetylmuramyl pentapeptide phosphotransferase/UDP-N-acetylglucosamine-1-phosphate transferase